MPRDKRAFITLHDGMPEHRKIEGLSSDAFRLLIELWCWCSRNRTDGDVPEATFKKRGTIKARRELVRVGLVKTKGDDYYMHDYLEHQRSAAEIDEMTRKRAAAGSIGGRSAASARASAAANLEASDWASAVAKPKQSRSKVQAETETDTVVGFSRSLR
jgi:hypothetical protein